MDYQAALISAFVMFIGLMLIIFKSGHWRKILPYHWWFDVGISFSILFYLQGSWAGQIGAGITGILLSVTFSIMHRCFKAERPRVVATTTYIGPFRIPNGARVEWVRTAR